LRTDTKEGTAAKASCRRHQSAATRGINVFATRPTQAQQQGIHPGWVRRPLRTQSNRSTGQRTGAGSASAVGRQRRVPPAQALPASGFVRIFRQSTPVPSFFFFPSPRLPLSSLFFWDRAKGACLLWRQCRCAWASSNPGRPAPTMERGQLPTATTQHISTKTRGKGLKGVEEQLRGPAGGRWTQLSSVQLLLPVHERRHKMEKKVVRVLGVLVERQMGWDGWLGTF
jgi:hypothetical protein